MGRFNSLKSILSSSKDKRDYSHGRKAHGRRIKIKNSRKSNNKLNQLNQLKGINSTQYFASFTTELVNVAYFYRFYIRPIFILNPCKYLLSVGFLRFFSKFLNTEI